MTPPRTLDLLIEQPTEDLSDEELLLLADALEAAAVKVKRIANRLLGSKHISLGMRRAIDHLKLDLVYISAEAREAVASAAPAP